LDRQVKTHEEDDMVKNVQSKPTVQPATIEGTDPDLAYPTMPPPAVTAARIYEGIERLDVVLAC
jgi:hypothetical protein